MSIKGKYEISIWEDFLVEATYYDDGNIKDPPYYDERKLAIIGSDTMTSQCRAIEPKLVENVNGTNTLSFKMYYTYVDNETGEKYKNPFIGLLVNERKIKAFWKNKWYDLVIKGIQEDSKGKSVIYTCKDLYANELSKNGFNLEFSTELKNNQGTVTYLGQRIVDGTDWTIDDKNSDIIQQTKEEPVYEAEVISEDGFEANQINGDNGITIAKGTKIFVFYSIIQDLLKEIEKGSISGTYKNFQFAQIVSQKSNSTEMLIDDANNFVLDNIDWTYNNKTIYFVFKGK